METTDDITMAANGVNFLSFNSKVLEIQLNIMILTHILTVRSKDPVTNLNPSTCSDVIWESCALQEYTNDLPN